MVARRLNPFRYALEPAVAAGVVALIAATSVRPLLVLSGAIVLVLGGRVYYNHGGLGDRWNAWHQEATPFGLGGLTEDAHLLLSGLLVGVLGASLVATGASAAVLAAA